jgi:hypothetical protein
MTWSLFVYLWMTWRILFTSEWLDHYLFTCQWLDQYFLPANELINIFTYEWLDWHLIRVLVVRDTLCKLGIQTHNFFSKKVPWHGKGANTGSFSFHLFSHRSSAESGANTLYCLEEWRGELICWKIRLCLVHPLWRRKVVCWCSFFFVPVHSSIFLFHVVSFFQRTSLSAAVYKKMPRICKYIQSVTRVHSVKSSIESGYVHQHTGLVAYWSWHPP